MQKQHRPFIAEITTNGQEYKSPEWKFDSDVKRITGVQIVSTDNEMPYFRGTCKIEINGQDIIPDKYPTKALMNNQGVPTNERFNEHLFNGGIDAGNQMIVFRYQDNDHSSAAFTAYKIQLLFTVEI